MKLLYLKYKLIAQRYCTIHRRTTLTFAMVVTTLSCAAQDSFNDPPMLKFNISADHWQWPLAKPGLYSLRKPTVIQSKNSSLKVTIHQVLDVAEFNPDIERWAAQRLTDNPGELVSISEPVEKINNFNVSRLLFSSGIQKLVAICYKEPDIHIWLECNLDSKKKIKLPQETEFKALLSSIAFITEEEMDTYFGYPLKSDQMDFSLLKQRIVDYALYTPNDMGEYCYHVIWDYSVLPFKLLEEETYSDMLDTHGYKPLAQTFLPETKMVFSFARALKEYRGVHFGQFDPQYCQEVFLRQHPTSDPEIYSVHRDGNYYNYSILSYEQGLANENARRTEVGKFEMIGSNPVWWKQDPTSNVRWMILWNKSTIGITTYEKTDNGWTLSGELDLPDPSAGKQRTFDAYNNARFYFDDDQSPDWFIVEQYEYEVMDGKGIVHGNKLHLFDTNNPTPSSFRLDYAAPGANFSQEFMVDIDVMYNPNSDHRINAGPKPFLIFNSRQFESHALKLAEGISTIDRIAYFPINEAKSSKSTPFKFDAPGKRLFHLPSVVSDLNNNGFDEIWISSISDGRIVHLDLVEDSDTGWVRTNNPEAWLEMIAGLPCIKLVMGDSREEQLSEDLMGFLNYPVEALSDEDYPAIYDERVECKNARFPGGGDAMYTFINQRRKYSTGMRSAGIKGTVLISARVGVDGTISDVKLKKGIDGGESLNQQAIEIVKAFPAFEPANNRHGTKIAVNITIPITFE